MSSINTTTTTLEIGEFGTSAYVGGEVWRIDSTNIPSSITIGGIFIILFSVLSVCSFLLILNSYIIENPMFSTKFSIFLFIISAGFLIEIIYSKKLSHPK